MDHAEYSWVFREWLEDLLVVLPNSEHQWECQFGLLVGISKKDDKHQTFYSCIGIFWVFTVLIKLHWYLIIVFKWNSLMTCNVEFFSSYFLAICLSSLVRCLFTSFPHCYVILYFLEQFQSHCKIEWKLQIPCVMLCFQTYITSSVINIPLQSGTFVIHRPIGTIIITQSP